MQGKINMDLVFCNSEDNFSLDELVMKQWNLFDSPGCTFITPGLRRAPRSSRGYVCLALGLGRKLVRIVVCWYFGSDAYLISRIDSNWEMHIQNENSAEATSQRFSYLNILRNPSQKQGILSKSVNLFAEQLLSRLRHY